MLDEVRILDEIDAHTYRMLWTNLGGITEEELDWRPHARANSVRWILGHTVWFEEWAVDAIHDTGRYHDDDGPVAYQLESIEEIRERFDRARERYRAATAHLTETDLTREIDHLGSPAPLREMLRAHTTHTAGSRYQIRYIRGAYSRAHDTDKAEFDPW